jgi:hypothetical protein
MPIASVLLYESAGPEGHLGGSLYAADLKGVYRIYRFGHPILMASAKDSLPAYTAQRSCRN